MVVARRLYLARHLFTLLYISGVDAAVAPKNSHCLKFYKRVKHGDENDNDDDDDGDDRHHQEDGVLQSKEEERQLRRWRP